MARPVLPTPAMAPDLEHGVLHHVFGIRGVADDAQRDRVGAIDVTLDQHAERDLVAGGQLVEKLAVLIEDDHRQRPACCRDASGTDGIMRHDLFSRHASS